MKKRIKALTDGAKRRLKGSNKDPEKNYRDEVIVGIPQAVLTNGNNLLLMATLGMNGEAGEFSEFVKKWMYQGRPFPREQLLLELGDVRWYLETAAIALGVTMAEVEAINVKKLTDRRARLAAEAAAGGAQ